MTAIYEPAGAALEYSPLACNLYRGCTHGCKYCYAPKVLRMSRDEFHGGTLLRAGILEGLRKDLFRLQRQGDQRPVLFCFTSDPYQDGVDCSPTRAALELMRAYDHPFAVLTKGGTRAAADFGLYGPRDAFGTTLLFSEDDSRQEWEPDAASVEDRIAAITKAHERGIRTFVSIEPVVYPEQALAVIRRLAPVVDEFRVGKLNHHPAADAIDWKAFGLQAIELLNRLGVEFLIKDALAAHLPAGSRLRYISEDWEALAADRRDCETEQLELL